MEVPIARDSGKPTDLPKRKVWPWAVFGSLFVAGAWGANLAVSMGWFGLATGTGVYGTVGDTFGVVNALFSGLAFVLLVVSIRMQSQELALQREELAHTREELAGQRAEMEVQNTTASLQRFENSFYEMLRLRRTMVGELTTTLSREGTHFSSFVSDGWTAFQQAFQSHQGSSRDKRDFAQGQHRNSRLRRLVPIELITVEVTRLIAASSIDDKRIYVRILQSQMQQEEQHLLLYWVWVEGHSSIVQAFKQVGFFAEVGPAWFLGGLVEWDEFHEFMNGFEDSKVQTDGES